MKNMMFEKVEYKYDETRLGVWRRFLYPDGRVFEEFVSHHYVMGLPLIHYTRGQCPETGRRIMATGVFAFGRMARGVVAFGQLSIGIIAVGQLAIGFLVGFGQATTGLLAVGQLAVGGVFGLGQIATGTVAIGQFGIGRYVLAQLGLGQYIWDTRGANPIAEQFFRSFLP